jgi:hypothetical protein
VDPRAGLDTGEQENLFTLPRIERRFVGPTGRSLVTTPTITVEIKNIVPSSHIRVPTRVSYKEGKSAATVKRMLMLGEGIKINPSLG